MRDRVWLNEMEVTIDSDVCFHHDVHEGLGNLFVSGLMVVSDFVGAMASSAVVSLRSSAFVSFVGFFIWMRDCLRKALTLVGSSRITGGRESLRNALGLQGKGLLHDSVGDRGVTGEVGESGNMADAGVVGSECVVSDVGEADSDGGARMGMKSRPTFCGSKASGPQYGLGPSYNGLMSVTEPMVIVGEFMS